MISIEQITPHLTWQLRRDVLYPGEYKFNMEMPEDEHGYHFGAFTENKLVGVVSLFKNGNDWQFRKLAVDEAWQGKGIGKELLNYITGFAIEEHGERLWCNARTSAIGFYKKYDFAQTGAQFSKKGVDYVIMEKSLVSA
ncbi:GNAT family N-acetyltransferase [Mucilaginibacter conchicola]|uniref:GNAT family N-acetyltransferase n=1 Tax=Mucilaginibacter conchicola TaxID=2303333 RepID=A0A372NYI8_9SPHI|nr:GNAT family N-acetyltransferase [Mucilaginibacter conchicola]RFZ95188.1 GNAT family N-acetyltransferase [Mucilaginibacter conchicola]